MTDLHAALDRAVADVHADLAPDALWRKGSRRRTRRRAATAVGSALAVLLLVLAVVPLLPGSPSGWAPASREGAPLTYPQRIGHQAWVRDLPAAPGPLALVGETGPGSGSESAELFAVTPGGTRYRVPGARTQVYPALSPDGRRLAYCPDGPDSRLHLRDLVTGQDVATGAALLSGSSARPDVQLSTRSPLFFSPSGSRLAYQWTSPVVVEADGTVRPLTGLRNPADPSPAGAVHRRVVGWDDDDTLAVVETVTGRSGAVLRVDARSGAVASRVDLAGVTDPGDQWTWTLSPDGTELAERTWGSALPDGRTTPPVVRVRRLSDAGTVAVRSGVEGVGPVFFLGRVVTTWSDGALRVLPAPGDPAPSEPVVVSDVPLSWVRLAAGAQTPTPTLFATRTAWITWWWREVTVALVAGAALVALARRQTRKR